MRRGAVLAALGLLVGTALSLAGGALVSSLLYGVTAADTLAFLAAMLPLAAVALLASYLPARLAARTVPMVALRHE